MKSKEPADSQTTLNYKTILVICYGRSGSTLLQGILNSIDSVLVKGENNNVFYHFYCGYRELLANSKRFNNSVSPAHPWFGSCWFNEDEFMHDFRKLARSLLASNRKPDAHRFTTLGFKEIRYPRLENPVPYIEFLISVFDAPCIIHLTRNHYATALSQSKKLKNKRSVSIAEIVSELERFDEQMELLSTRPYYFHIDYEEMVNPDKRVLAELFMFLGAEYDDSAVNAVMSIPHSY